MPLKCTELYSSVSLKDCLHGLRISWCGCRHSDTSRRNYVDTLQQQLPRARTVICCRSTVSIATLLPQHLTFLLCDRGGVTLWKVLYMANYGDHVGPNDIPYNRTADYVRGNELAFSHDQKDPTYLILIGSTIRRLIIWMDITNLAIQDVAYTPVKLSR